MWTQLELFDEKTEEEFAMSLTNFQLYALRESNPKAYNWIKQVRCAIQEYESKCRSLKMHLDQNLIRAKWRRTDQFFD
jgi:hypothetical protein